jgi:hypothetical protein
VTTPTPTITHAAWRGDMTDAITILRVLGARLDTRIAELQGRGAGPEHLALLRQRYAGLMETAQLGDLIIADTDDRVIPVGEAIATAGGTDWIAEDKEFNTTG